MRKIIGGIIGALVMVGVMLAPVWSTSKVMAVSESEALGVDAMVNDGDAVFGADVLVVDELAGFSMDTLAVSTSILPEEMCAEEILWLILDILVYGLGAAATLGVIIAGVLYMTARDSEQQVAKAKQRLIEIAIGLLAWAVMFTVLNWLVPGGLNRDATKLCPNKSQEASEENK